MLTKKQINNELKTVKEILKPFGGEIFIVDHDYQYFVYKNDGVRIVFYPYKNASDIRMRDDNSQNKEKLNILMEVLERKGKCHRKLHAYWSKWIVYSKCCDVAVINTEEGKSTCGWCKKLLAKDEIKTTGNL